MQYRVGQARVLGSNHNQVELSGGAATDGAWVGKVFKFLGESVLFQIASIVDGTHFTLSTDYTGAKAFDQDFPYLIALDFTPDWGIPELSPGDVDIRDIVTRAMRVIDAKLTDLDDRVTAVEEAP